MKRLLEFFNDLRSNWPVTCWAVGLWIKAWLGGWLG
jgi:hypothetical protein